MGLGFSSIVVGNARACTAGHANGSDTIFCFDAVTGNGIWKQSYPTELGDKFYEGGTTGTPTLDGNRLYWLSRWGDLYCFDAASGKIVWNRQLVRKTAARVPSWGFSGAPTGYKNLLILNVGDAGMAVDKMTGKEVWKSGEGAAGCNTPLAVTRGDKTEIWFANGEALLSVAPETGQENWRMKWLAQYGVNASDPIPFDDKVFISSGGKSWTAPVFANGLVYCRNSRGDLVAVDLCQK